MMFKKKNKLSNKPHQEITFDLFKKINELGKQLIVKTDLQDVLTTAMDRAIELASAERGLIILGEDEKKIRFEVARNVNKQDIDQPEFEISRTIIENVISSKKGVLLRNAMDDPLYSKNNSVFRLKILSVICLPLMRDTKVFGAIYLDSRSAQGVFAKEIYEFVREFTDFISVAAFHALQQKRLQNRVSVLENELREKYRFEAIIGHHPKMMEVLKLVSQVADINATVLIQGESGTGKELIARALHFNSSRRDKPFVPINCGALAENLLESELFGHVKGAFTGATADKIGWFERASGGTIFLDEINEMSPGLQVKLLRILQSGEYSPVGSTEIRICDVRIVAASIKNLKDLVATDRFREDLYYRLNIIDIQLPSLRERRSDIPVLIRHFIDTFKKQYKKTELSLSQKAEALLLAYDYPGNVRELENIIQRAVVLAEGKKIEPGHLPAIVSVSTEKIHTTGKLSSYKLAKQRLLEKFERDYVIDCLQAAKGNISQAAKIAGIQYANFFAKVKKYGVEPARFKEK